MWNRKLCLYANMNRYIPDTIRMIGKAGFDATFFTWTRTNPVEECIAAVRESNLALQSIHAPFTLSADMWKEDKERGDLALQELKDCLLFCARHEAPIMVTHTYIGFEEGPGPGAAGIDRFGELIRMADKYGVKIAFENTEGEAYLAKLMQTFGGEPSVGFCWDTGHEMCYNHSKDMLELYGDKLICTHLNDNLGIRDFGGRITYLDDLHLLPFDGIADWDNIANRLKAHRFDDTLTFELTIISKPGRHENDVYARMDPQDYLAEAYKRACRVAQKCR